MRLPTKSEVDAASRHILTAAGVAVTIFGLQAKGVSMDNVKVVIESLGNTVNSILQLVAAVGVLYGGIQAFRSASPTSQIAAADKIAQDPSAPENRAAAVALISGVRKIAEQSAAPALDASTLESAARPAGTATQLQLGKDAKAALIDAAAAQPEVVGDIRVTDPALAQATVSPQVKAA